MDQYKQVQPDLERVCNAHHEFIVKEVVTMNSEIQLSKDHIATKHSHPQSLGLMFYKDNPKKQMQLLHDSIQISDFGYQGFDDFYSLVSEIARFLNATYNLGSIHKVGFRKINAVTITDVARNDDILAIFNETLFGSLRSGLFAVESIQQIEDKFVLENSNRWCRFKAIIQKTEKIDTYETFLDFDFVDKNPYTFDQAINDALPSLNQWHYDLFLWSVTRELIKAMEG